MEVKKEYGVRRTTTKKVFPSKGFKTMEEAERNRTKHADPDGWELVERTVTYGDWSPVGRELIITEGESPKSKIY